MGTMGTGVIAGVAQAALQAQQVGRQRDQRSRTVQRTADRQKEIARVRVEGLEELDGAEDATRIRIDNQVPDHERHDLPHRRSRHHDPNGAQPDAPDPQHANAPGNGQPLPLPAGAPPVSPPSGTASDLTATEPASHLAAVYQHAGDKDKPTHRLDVEG